jgi:hypothetical protein
MHAPSTFTPCQFIFFMPENAYCGLRRNLSAATGLLISGGLVGTFGGGRASETGRRHEGEVVGTPPGFAGVSCCPHIVMPTRRVSDACAAVLSAGRNLISGAEAMRFSWTGLILAPLLVPLMFCAVMLSASQTNGSVSLFFLMLLILSCVVSYGTTIFLFLPSLFLLSLWRPMTGLKACLLGLVLGAVVFVPLTLLAWKGSGPDSGPPTESFWVFFLGWVADPLTAIFPIAGLVTAGLYWWLGTRRRDSRSPDFTSPR